MHFNRKTSFFLKESIQKFISFPRFFNVALLITFSFLLISCSSEKKEEASVSPKNGTAKKMMFDESGRLLLDSMISSYMIIPWNESISKTIVLKQKETLDSLQLENSVLLESAAHGRRAYVFKNGQECLGSFVTDSTGTLQFFNPSLFCLDTIVESRDLMRILWNAKGVPAIFVSESYQERGSALRIRRLDRDSGEVFIDEKVSNADICGPEEDEGVIPCFEWTTTLLLDDSSSVLPDTLKYKRMGTVLENKRVLPMNQTDSVIINWQ